MVAFFGLIDAYVAQQDEFLPNFGDLPETGYFFTIIGLYSGSHLKHQEPLQALTPGMVHTYLGSSNFILLYGNLLCFFQSINLYAFSQPLICR